MATKSGSMGGSGAQLKHGGKKGAATPPKRSVGDANTKQMAASTWTPRHMRSGR